MFIKIPLNFCWGFFIGVYLRYGTNRDKEVYIALGKYLIIKIMLKLKNKEK